MPKADSQTKQRRLISLPLRIAFGLVFATIIPLAVTLFITEWQTQPILSDRANDAMQSDAKSRVELIDTYLKERVLDAQTITQVATVQQYLATPPAPTDPAYQDQVKHTVVALAAGMYRDKNYTTWQLYDSKGKIRLYYPTTTAPQPHGKDLVPGHYLDNVLAGQDFISTVYFSNDSKATVDIYAPVKASTPEGKTTNKLLGFIRVTLGLDRIWDSVKSDTQNGKGSYAFILNEDGIRIADTDQTRVLQAIDTLPANVRQEITDEKRYGDIDPVPVTKDPTLSQHLRNKENTYKAKLAGQSEEYQIVQKSTTEVPWKYFVLSPVSTVNAVANQQLQTTIIIAFVMSGLMAIIGLFTGQSLTRPILRAANSLRDSSDALSSLASRQRDAATEQMWVVESSQIGLQSVQYYTEAINTAATQLANMANSFTHQLDQLDQQRLRQAIERVQSTSKYIENAAQYQNDSNKKLSTALNVTNQVTEQLASGATSATEAAAQLEEVVKELRAVVG
ncbi:cache domain-containing protein [Ktedonospora formicarum]|uniref:Methyl-accepting chemotaxis protein n=1 Tax=Ktedonospora formicarum TaxID=2778364 RepID=A0A8J3HXQ6_9CHLR|nr:cache domain-containing protein [Ktedonospora formicarum]GHO45674.1 hypothetical protein KSX_38370 [Ktedonospora formicarum]